MCGIRQSASAGANFRFFRAGARKQTVWFRLVAAPPFVDLRWSGIGRKLTLSSAAERNSGKRFLGRRHERTPPGLAMGKLIQRLA
jgi:hypothetical protein